MLSSIPFQGSSPSSSMERELATSGVLTSPNFPDFEGYLSNLNLVQKIQVPEGNTIRICFVDLNIEHGLHDVIIINDKDGTPLGFLYGGKDGWQNEIVSNTDTVEVVYETDGSGPGMGWRLNWGEHKVLITILCHSLNF